MIASAALRRRAVAAAVAGATAFATAGVAGVFASRAGAGEAADPVLVGGATTVFANGRTAFSFPAANLTEPERTRFVIGNSFFRRNWVEAPSSTKARDGLGPHFIARSCGGCHVQDGRGPPPEMQGGRNVDPPVALLFGLSVPDPSAPRIAADAPSPVRPEPVYGDQFATSAVQGVRPEGRVEIRTRPVQGRFADGSAYTLAAPEYRFTDLGYGPLAKDVLVGPRLAPQVIGIGLIEAIPEAEILKNAEDQARRGGPVRGPNRVFDAATGLTLVGRFGWKANAPTVAHQTGAAFVNDVGITSSLFPEEACTPAQADCRSAPKGGGGASAVEIDDRTFSQVVFYQATVAPPARRDIDDPQVRAGERLFTAAGCNVCHRPSYRTGVPAVAATHPEFTSPALVGQTIFPYTDLLLHDMGPDLADGRPDALADGRQWRTPPLWGIGLIHAVNGHQRLLHDGRARGVLEAILWHGGEAASSREHVLGLSATDRAALVRFVDSL